MPLLLLGLSFALHGDLLNPLERIGAADWDQSLMFAEMARKSIDNGACACYIQGGIGDELVAQGKFDLIAETLVFSL